MTSDLFGFQPSRQQAAFLDVATSGQGHVILEASAGAGKTSTLVEAVDRMPGTKFLGAFNKAIAGELRKRISANAVKSETAIASTMHSAGYRAWRQRYPKAAFDEHKTRRVFRELALERGFDLRVVYEDYVINLVSFAMSSGLGLNDPHDIDNGVLWQAVSDHFDADQWLDKDRAKERGLELTEKTGILWSTLTLKRSLEKCRESMSFDEMLYAPLYEGVAVPRYDNVLIDEAQDSSVPRIMLSDRMLAPGGRLFAVGDRHQSIYGFAGADVSAMENIGSRFGCILLPLSVSFRCPRSVVLYAQQFVGLHIEPASNAKDGIVRRVPKTDDWWQREKLMPQDVILCRFNAPLVKMALQLLRDGIPCRMAGRELGGALKRLAKRGGSSTLDALEPRLQDWLREEIKVAGLREKPERAAAAHDMVETMQILIDRCRELGHHTVTGLIAEIDRLFVQPSVPAVLLSSIHKAKGQEWRRVFWLQTKPVYQSQDWQRQQEVNLQYVATTRAMHELVLVEDERTYAR